MIRPKLQCTHSEIIIDVCHQKDQKLDPQRNIISEIRNAYGPERARAMCGVKEREPERNFRIQVTNTECRGINSKETTRLSSQTSRNPVALSRQNASSSTPKLKGLRPQASVIRKSCGMKRNLIYPFIYPSIQLLHYSSATVLSHPGISPYLPPPLQGFNPQTRRQVT